MTAMKTKPHVGNVTLILDGPIGNPGVNLLLGRKRPKRKSDAKRKRQKVGCGLFVPPGGGTEPEDKSQKHAAQREVLQETGLRLPLNAFRKAGTLRGYMEDGRPIWFVHLYLVSIQHAEPRVIPGEEFTEIKWFPATRLPFHEMLSGDKDWIPEIIQGKKISVRIVFDYDTDIAKEVIVKEIGRLS